MFSELEAVSRDAFFEFVVRDDIHPRLDVSSLKGRFYTSTWETKDRHVVGKSVSDSWGVEATEFYLTKATS